MAAVVRLRGVILSTVSALVCIYPVCSDTVCTPFELYQIVGIPERAKAAWSAVISPEYLVSICRPVFLENFERKLRNKHSYFKDEILEKV